MGSNLDNRGRNWAAGQGNKCYYISHVYGRRRGFIGIETDGRTIVMRYQANLQLYEDLHLSCEHAALSSRPTFPRAPCTSRGTPLAHRALRKGLHSRVRFPIYGRVYHGHGPGYPACNPNRNPCERDWRNSTLKSFPHRQASRTGLDTTGSY